MINACVWYDRTKKANIGKRGHIYQAATYTENDGFDDDNPYEAPWGDPSQGIDTPSDEVYNINTTHASPPMSSIHKMRPRLPRCNSGPNQFPKKQPNQKWTGPISLPGHVYKLLSQEAKDGLQKYNVEAIEKFKSRTVHGTNFVSDIHEDSQDMIALSNEELKMKAPNQTILTKI